MLLRDVTIAQVGNGGDRVRVTSRTGSTENLGCFEKFSKVEDCLGRRRLTFACSPRPWAGVARDGWQMKKPE